MITEDLSVYYPTTEVQALRNVNLKIRKGEAVLILGRTGAGKTTLLLTLSKIIPNYVTAHVKGKVFVNGIDIAEEEPENLAKHISIVMQDPSMQIISLTVFDEVIFGPLNLGYSYEEIMKRAEDSMRATRLTGLETRNPRELSGGQQQAVIIASILAMGSDIISLDEPISMLDPIGKTLVLSTLKNLKAMGKTVLITESGSDLEYVINSGLIDRIILLKKGEVVADGPPHEILSREDVLRESEVNPPQVTELFMKLGRGLSEDGVRPITVEEALRAMSNWTFKAPRRSVKSTPAETRRAIISVKNVEFIYPNGVKALKGVNLEVYDGVVQAIIGQNGSGKTTLAKILVGLLKPTNQDSEVIVDGMDIRNMQLEDIIKKINYVFQNPAEQLFCDTVIEELVYGPKTLGVPEDQIKERLNKIVKLFNLEGKLNKYIISLTQGEKRMVAVASIAMLKPKILIVDEVTGGLDMLDARRLLNALMKLKQEEGLTIIMITHDMRVVAEYADQVAVMSDGKIVCAGTPREIFGRRIEELKKLSLIPPQITVLANELNKIHSYIPKDILSIDEFIECVG